MKITVDKNLGIDSALDLLSGFLRKKAERYPLITEAETAAIHNTMDEYNLSSQRRRIIDTALSLVGKVRYDRWSRHTGTYRQDIPTYLDCSSFVSWVYLHALGIDLSELTTAGLQVDARLTKISAEELRPGDLIFKTFLGDTNHVAIYLGPSAGGCDVHIQIIDCTDARHNNTGNVYYRTEDINAYPGYLMNCYRVVGVN